MPNAAIYARVSTSDQDVQRQLDECREYIDRAYPDVEEPTEYADIVSGVDEGGGEEYLRLWDAIEAGEYAVVVVHEISRLSRLGPTEIHEFIQHCLENGTGVESLDVGLSIRVDDPALQQTVYTMIANIMGDLAKIEHQQKLERVRSGIRAAQRVGKWTGRPPKGFYVDKKTKRLHVESGEFLDTREALARIARGESIRRVAEQTGIPESTLSRLNSERRELYFTGDAEDDRIDAALDELRPLDELDASEAGALDARIRQIVREEVGGENDE